jgi:hypothetical protein
VQLTVLSNLCEPSQSSAERRPGRQRERARVAASGRATCASRHGSRFGGVFHARAHLVGVEGEAAAVERPTARRSLDSKSSKTRGRLASMPVRPQFDVAALAAAGKEADLKTEMLRAQTQAPSRARSSRASEKPTSPAPLPPSGTSAGERPPLQRQRSSNRGSAPPMPRCVKRFGIFFFNRSINQWRVSSW